jgi:hypothetical protein
MLTLEDCIAFCDLTEAEIDAIAEHEHVPEMAALEFGAYLVLRADGCATLRQIIVDDIALAQRHEHFAHSAQLELVLEAFDLRHGGTKPDPAEPGATPAQGSPTHR